RTYQRYSSAVLAISPLSGLALWTVSAMYSLRKSCERCGFLKRKCDGATPCSRCVRMGVEGGCIYSKRTNGKRAPSMQAAGATKLGARHDGFEHVAMKR
ncbi:unnamed protein product, partial [Ectocarpus fasciculatus]